MCVSVFLKSYNYLYENSKNMFKNRWIIKKWVRKLENNAFDVNHFTIQKGGFKNVRGIMGFLYCLKKQFKWIA